MFNDAMWNFSLSIYPSVEFLFYFFNGLSSSKDIQTCSPFFFYMQRNIHMQNSYMYFLSTGYGYIFYVYIHKWFLTPAAKT